MRKLILIGIVLLASTIWSRADVLDAVKSAVPNTTPGVIYNLQSHESNFLTTVTLVSRETKYGTVSLDAGYGESDMGAVGLMYKTETLEKLGIKVVFLKDLFAKVGYGVCMDHITENDREFGHGPMATFGANIKF